MGMYGVMKPVSQQDLDALIANDKLTNTILNDVGVVGLDKAWHAIHFTLAGDAWGGDGPLADAVMGGEKVGDDLCYGPARYLKPDAVRAVSSALSSLSTAAFSERLDPEALGAAEIYPGIWDDGPFANDYVSAHYELLRSTYEAAAAAGEGMLLAVL